MKQDPLIIKRFDELIQKGEVVLSTRRTGRHGLFFVETAIAEQWTTSCLSFLGRVFGKEGEHYVRFGEHSKGLSYYSAAERCFAVLAAANEDYRGGYLIDAVKRIQAEIFDDFLEQSEHFLKDGYFGVSAVITGAVLEDTLRKLCDKNGIVLTDKPKLDVMNADLAKKGVYDKLVQKKVTWLADIRNKAAHGKWTEFTISDAEEMLSATRRFAEDYA